jgi:site-specific recombinase XerD
MSKTSIDQSVSREVERLTAYLKAEKRSENTVQQYGDTLEGFLTWYGNPQEGLTKQDMQRWKGHLATELKYCENTMSTKIAAVNQYTERILERPDLKMRTPRLVFRSKIALTEGEVRRILDEAKKPRAGRNGRNNNPDMSLRDHAEICLMYYGGLRVSEVINLRLSDLDLDNKKLRVHQGKGMDFSLVNLSSEAVQGVRDYLEHGRPRPAKPEYADRVFLSSKGAPIGKGKLWPMVKRIAFWAGIEKNVHPHIFRHSMITHMAEKGLSASFIQAQSRHKSLDMVERYTHLSAQSVRVAYDKVFSKQEPIEEKTSAQKQSRPPEALKSEKSVKERFIEAFLDGKISEDMISDKNIGKLEKLVSMMDGPKDKAPHFEGYA